MTPLRRLLWTSLVVLVAASLARGMQPYFEDTNVVMVYMLAVVTVAFLFGLWPATIACLLGVVLFDFINVAPYFAFTAHVFNYLFTLGVMFVTAATISTLADRLRQRAAESDDRAARAAALYALSAELADSMSELEILTITERHIAQAFRAQVKVIAVDAGQPSGLTSQRTPDGNVTIQFPLQREQQVFAILQIVANAQSFADGEQEAHLRAMARLAEQAVERAALRERVHVSEARSQQESLRSSILGAVSHDLRTPLASIIGASSTLLAEGERFTPEARASLRRVIYEEAVHMQRMIENLLDLARLRSGEISNERGWQAIEEIVGSTMASMRRRVTDHEFIVDVPGDLPLIRCDGVLIERVLSNLVENAAKYSPPGSAISVSAAAADGMLVLKVSDQGSGIAEHLREKVFEPFFRAGTGGGSGLGLAICRGIVEAHAGSIHIDSTPTGGACAVVCLPLPPTGATPGMRREEIIRSA